MCHHGHSDSCREGELHLMGNIRVGGNALFRQPALFKDSVTIEGALTCHHLHGHDRGMFASYDVLRAACRSPHRGDWALVGNSATPELWSCSVEGHWELVAESIALEQAIILDADHIADHAVTREKIACGAVDTCQIADGAVTLDKTTGIQEMVESMGANLTTRIDQVALDAAQADAGQSQEISELRDHMVRSVSLNHGTRYYPAADGHVNIIAAVNPDGSIDPGLQQLSETVEQHTEDIQALREAIQELPVPSESDAGDTVDYTANPLYPEAYGAKGDGIDFYDWPLRCYHGLLPDDVDNDVNVITHVAAVARVFAPGERIVYIPTSMLNYDGSTHFHTTDDVFYSARLRKFVLRMTQNGVTRYYTQSNDAYTPGYLDEEEEAILGNWGFMGNDMAQFAFHLSASSAAWNAGDHARTDCVFSDISESGDTLSVENENIPGSRVEVGVLRRRTSIYDADKATLVDIDTLMTDDTEAIYRCLAANNGSMCLAPGKIYYFSPLNLSNLNRNDVIDHNPFQEQSHIVIEGHGVTLFPRRWGIYPVGERYKAVGYASGDVHIPDQSVSLFQFWNTCNAVVRNLNICTLRDRDNGAPGGHYRIGCSDSNINAFGINQRIDSGITCGNLRLENIRTKGMCKDFTGGGGYNIHVDHYSSENFTHNYLPGTKVSVFRHVKMLQNEFVGDGMHVFYGGSGQAGLHFTDCHFRAGAYSSVMISLHASASWNNIARHTYFDSCVFEGCQFFTGQKLQTDSWAHFHNCTFHQLYKRQVNQNRAGYLTQSAVFNGNSQNFSFTGCQFLLNGASLIIYDSNMADKNIALVMRDCLLKQLDRTTPRKVLVNFPATGKVITEGITLTTEETSTGLSLDWTPDGGLGAEFHSGYYDVAAISGKADGAVSSISDLQIALYGIGTQVQEYATLASLPVSAAAGTVAYVTATAQYYQVTSDTVGERCAYPLYVSNFVEGTYEGDVILHFTAEESVTLPMSVTASTKIELATHLANLLLAEGYSAVVKGSESSSVYVYVTAKRPGAAVHSTSASQNANVAAELHCTSDPTVLCRLKVMTGGTSWGYKAGSDSTWVLDETPGGLFSAVRSHGSVISTLTSPPPDPVEGEKYFDGEHWRKYTGNDWYKYVNNQWVLATENNHQEEQPPIGQ